MKVKNIWFKHEKYEVIPVALSAMVVTEMTEVAIT